MSEQSTHPTGLNRTCELCFRSWASGDTAYIISKAGVTLEQGENYHTFLAGDEQLVVTVCRVCIRKLGGPMAEEG